MHQQPLAGGASKDDLRGPCCSGKPSDTESDREGMKPALCRRPVSPVSKVVADLQGFTLQGEELFWKFPGVWKPGRSSYPVLGGTAPVHAACPRAKCCRGFPHLCPT